MEKECRPASAADRLITLINEKEGRPCITNYDIRNATGRPIGNLNTKIESLISCLQQNGEDVSRFFWQGSKDRGYQNASDPLYGMYEEGFYLWLMSVRDNDKDLGISAKTKLIKAFKSKDQEIKAIRAQQAGLTGVFSAEPICKENILIKFAEALTYNAHLISEHRQEINQLKDNQEKMNGFIQTQAKVIEQQTAKAEEDEKVIETQRLNIAVKDIILAITPASPTWRKSLNELIDKFATALYPGGPKEFRHAIYTEMSHRSEKGSIRWTSRINGYVSTMAKQGIKVNKNKVAYLDVIAANPVLKELYITVTKERLLRLMTIYGGNENAESKTGTDN